VFYRGRRCLALECLNVSRDRNRLDVFNVQRPANSWYPRDADEIARRCHCLKLFSRLAHLLLNLIAFNQGRLPCFNLSDLFPNHSHSFGFRFIKPFTKCRLQSI
jgi:hypothetical protein